MDYTQALEFIHGCKAFGSKKDGLNNITELLRLAGDPHKQVRCLHIAGTNGKGSVSAFCHAILSAAGYRTGLYTSPYLQRYNERMRMKGQIGDEDLAHLAARTKDFIADMLSRGRLHPTEFEVGTAIAYQWFAREKADAAVIEVGLGGRLDPTNVIDPVLSVITNIGLDHTRILGDTPEKIASEKAGIIKPGRPVVLYPQRDGVRAVIERICAERNAPLYDLSDCRIDVIEENFARQRFSLRWRDLELDDVSIRIAGPHQVKNAMVAAAACHMLNGLGFTVTGDAIRAGLKGAYWPGRLETVRQSPHVLLDGGHNPQGVGALLEALERYGAPEERTLVCAVLADKAADQMAGLLAGYFSHVVVTAPSSHRAMPVEDLAELFWAKGCKRVEVVPDAKGAVTRAIDGTPRQGMVVVCGSLYLIGEVRALFAESLQIPDLKKG